MICFLCMCFDKKETNEWKINTDVFKLQFLQIRSLAVQQTHKIYSVICTHSLFITAQWLYLNRIIYSAFKTVCAVFFDLFSFLYMYRESFFFFFFFFFSIDFKKITAWETNTNLTEKWKFDDNKETDAAAAMNKV